MGNCLDQPWLSWTIMRQGKRCKKTSKRGSKAAREYEPGSVVLASLLFIFFFFFFVLLCARIRVCIGLSADTCTLQWKEFRAFVLGIPCITERVPWICRYPYVNVCVPLSRESNRLSPPFRHLADDSAGRKHSGRIGRQQTD